MASAWINIPTARYEGAEPMVVLGAAVRLSGFASHQLAEQLEQWEAQGARRHPRLALGAQHLELDRLGARAHPRRYRRPMPRAAPRGHSAGCGRARAPTTVHNARSDPPRGRDSCAADTSAARTARAPFNRFPGVAGYMTMFTICRKTSEKPEKLLRVFCFHIIYLYLTSWKDYFIIFNLQPHHNVKSLCVE